MLLPTLTRLLAITLLLLAASRGVAAPVFEDCRLEAGPGQPTVAARCTSITVPLDYERPDDATLELFVAVVDAHTPTPAPDALTVIAGGPGQASSEFFAAMGGAFGRIQRQRDIVVVDQRGTGRSLRLDCEMPEDPALLEDAIQRIPEIVADCLAGLPADPRHFTTSAAVRDLERVREALGYPQLNVYGVSYGTRVAQHYARRYPGSTRSLILDAVLPADVALGPDIPILAQATLDRALARCEADEACARRFPDVAARLPNLLSGLDTLPAELTIADPLTGRPVQRVLTGHDVRAALRMMSYAPETLALVPLLLFEAAAGNLEPMRAQVELVLGELEQMLAIGMHNAVVCTEDLPFVTLDAELREALAGTYLGDHQLVMLEQICAAWPRGLLDDDLHTPLRGDIPTLILSGELDPITPPAYGDQVMAHLQRARHVVAPGQGHGLAHRGCVPRLMDRFVRDADPAGLDVDCALEMRAAPFFLDFTGPAP
ncbi:MAG: alpha/beta fold hydrolase [Gammaproteobacteria bacterium]|nr:alpha/beta fold hydrolase [Gammaproteobacteria bacterium]